MTEETQSDATGGPGTPPEGGGPDGPPRRPPGKRSRVIHIAVNAVLFAIIAGGAISVAAKVFLPNYGINLSSQQQLAFPLIGAMLVLVIAASSLLKVYLPKPKKKPSVADLTREELAALQRQGGRPADMDDAGDLSDDPPADPGKDAPAKPEPKADDRKKDKGRDKNDPPKAERTDTSKIDKAWKKMVKTTPKKAEPEPETGGGSKAPPETGGKPRKPVDPTKLNVSDVDPKQAVDDITARATGKVSEAGLELNAVERFSLNLFLTGACDALAKLKKLSKPNSQGLLRGSLIEAGSKKANADNFIINVPVYAKRARYMKVIEGGQKAMHYLLDKQENPCEDLLKLIDQSSKPESRAESEVEPTTFLFTDIVGSTQLTEQLGNKLAQMLIRLHNTVVRDAMAAHGGKEVKHTGDGIMAVFQDPPGAVRAANQIHATLHQKNKTGDLHPLYVRIGVNVGEAVEEEHDYFGTAVQITARLCNAAPQEKTWVSEAIKDACDGDGLTFKSQGKVAMKGLENDRAIYEAIWDSSAAAGAGAPAGAGADPAAPEGDSVAF